MSSLRRGHANLLCIVPIFADDRVLPRFRSTPQSYHSHTYPLTRTKRTNTESTQYICAVLCSAHITHPYIQYSTLQYSAVQHHVSRAARRTRPHFHQTKVTKVIAIRLYSRGETADMFQLNYKERTKIVPRMAVRKNIWLKNLFDCLCKGTRHNNNIVTIDRAQSRTM